MKIINDRLDPIEVEFVETNKANGPFPPGLPDTIIIHYTAGSSVEGAVATFTTSPIQASAHAVVGQDGSITQLVPFDIVAWHAGISHYGDRSDLNQYAIGIEIVNAGRLIKSGSEYVSWFGKSYAEKEVIEAIHRNEEVPTYWQRYTEAQISTVYDLCFDLIQEYNIKHILGHEEISPRRKIDPGPAFPLDEMREKLLHVDHSDTGEAEKRKLFENPATVTAYMLNIRSGPSTSNPTIADPLTKNTKVDIVDEANGWYQVEVKIKGWVSKKYIDKIS